MEAKSCAGAAPAAGFAHGLNRKPSERQASAGKPASLGQSTEEIRIIDEITWRIVGRRGAFGRIPQIKMQEDFLNDRRLVDDADDAHDGAAAGAGERVRFIDFADQTSPAAAALTTEFLFLLG